MKRVLPTIITLIFISSVVLLVFSLPQCGHNGFKLAPVSNNQAKSCTGNSYDYHLGFLQTVFLTKLEWLFLLLVVALVISRLMFAHTSRGLSMIKVNPKDNSKRYIYHLSASFNFLALIQFSGRIYQRLLE